MTTQLHNIKIKDLSALLLEKYKLSPDKRIDLSFNVVEDDTESADIDSLGEFLLEGFNEILAHKQGKIKFPPAL